MNPPVPGVPRVGDPPPGTQPDARIPASEGWQPDGSRGPAAAPRDAGILGSISPPPSSSSSQAALIYTPGVPNPNK